jgi:hypothetical protein
MTSIFKCMSIALLTIFGIHHLSGNAQDLRTGWTQIGESAALTYYVDFGTVRKTANGRRAWSFYDHKAPMQLSKGRSYSTSVLYEYDCEGERFRTLQSLAYSGHLGNGKVLETVLNQDGWRVPPPQSVSDKNFRIVCAAPLTN